MTQTAKTTDVRPTEGPWRQGVLLDTANTRRWTERQRQEQRQHERQRVFANFRSRDEGRSRTIVAHCSTENDARYIVAACNSYDRHFGPHAVSAAEGDLLGDCLKLIAAIAEWESGCNPAGYGGMRSGAGLALRERIDAILSQTREVRS